MDEVALIQAAKSGDLDAFNRLVIEYQGLAYNVALRILGDPAAAEDATQDAFVSAYRKLRTFRDGSFKAWLLRIVTNGCYDELRRQKRRPTTSLEVETDNGEEIAQPSWMADPGEGPDELAERAALSRAIQSCLDGMEDEFRAAVVLVDVLGLDYAEAAEALERPLGTIKSRLARARVRMQECLQSFAELLPVEMRLNPEATND